LPTLFATLSVAAATRSASAPAAAAPEALIPVSRECFPQRIEDRRFFRRILGTVSRPADTIAFSIKAPGLSRRLGLRVKVNKQLVVEENSIADESIADESLGGR
jgi:hypothetical protein